MGKSKFNLGEKVRVKSLSQPGHIRTPYFIRGQLGIVETLFGDYPNPEELAYGRSGKPAVPLYCVKFKQRHIWNKYCGEKNDTLLVDIYEHWLEKVNGIS